VVWGGRLVVDSGLWFVDIVDWGGCHMVDGGWGHMVGHWGHMVNGGWSDYMVNWGGMVVSWSVVSRSSVSLLPGIQADLWNSDGITWD